MGHCCSYDEMRAIDTSAAVEVLAKTEEFGTVNPSNISLVFLSNLLRIIMMSMKRPSTGRIPHTLLPWLCIRRRHLVHILHQYLLRTKESKDGPCSQRPRCTKYKSARHTVVDLQHLPMSIKSIHKCIKGSTILSPRPVRWI